MSYIYNRYKSEWSSQDQIDNGNLLLTQDRLKLEWNQMVWWVNNLGCGTAGKSQGNVASGVCCEGGFVSQSQAHRAHFGKAREPYRCSSSTWRRFPPRHSAVRCALRLQGRWKLNRDAREVLPDCAGSGLPSATSVPFMVYVYSVYGISMQSYAR